MKQEDWTKQLRDKLADHEVPAPADLWADIEARLQQEGIMQSSEKEAPKRPTRLIPLWGKRIAVAAAFIGVITCNGYLMWQLGRDEMAKRETAQALEAPATSMKSEEPKSDSPALLKETPSSPQYSTLSRLLSSHRTSCLRRRKYRRWLLKRLQLNSLPRKKSPFHRRNLSKRSKKR